MHTKFLSEQLGTAYMRDTTVYGRILVQCALEPCGVRTHREVQMHGGSL
jgi:hypothetical protein